MRITKKTLREAKSGMVRRLRELVFMEDSKVEAEHKRCSPHLQDGQRPALTPAQRWDLVSDCIELSLPSHWLD